MDCRPARLNGNKFIIKTGEIFSKPNFRTTKKPFPQHRNYQETTHFRDIEEFKIKDIIYSERHYMLK